MPAEPRSPEADRDAPLIHTPPNDGIHLARVAARTDPVAADGEKTDSGKRDADQLTRRERVVGIAHAAQLAQAGGPVAHTAAKAIGVVDAAKIASDVAQGKEVRALDVASAASSAAWSAAWGGRAVQLGAQAIAGVSAIDAADRALNTLKTKLREADPADVEQRKSIERRNDEMLAVPRNGLDEQAARQAVKLDIASLHQIDNPRERHAASVAIGHNAESQSSYKAALARQDPAAAEAVALSYAKEDRAISAKEDRKAAEFGAPGVTKAPVNSIEYVFPRDRQAEAPAPRHHLPPLEDRFDVVSRLRGRDYQFRDQSGKVAFRERWLSMTSAVDSPVVVKAMLDRADERGWKEVRVKGSEEFQRQAWIAATARGIKAVGYEPTDGDRVAANEERARLERERRGVAVQAGGAIPREAQRASSISPGLRERNAEPSAPRARSIEPSPAADRPGDNGRERAPASPSQDRPVPQEATRNERPSGRDAAILAALEVAFEKKNVPEALRNGLRDDVRKELDARYVSGQAVKVAVYDPAASRQVPRSVQVPQRHPKVHERAR